MLSIKAGAKIEGLQPEILLGLAVIQEVFRKYAVEVVVTEATGGEHMQGSFHYAGLALDLRSKHISVPTVKSKILLESKLALGDDFDLILENFSTENEHFHLEYDPRIMKESCGPL